MENSKLNNTVPLIELTSRWSRCRKLLKKFLPECQGVLFFSRLNIYYFTGSYSNGVLWLPLDGDPFLFCRRGVERAKIDSSLKHIYSIKSYKDIVTSLDGLGFTLPKFVAVEMNGLSWTLSQSLTKHLSHQKFVSADKIIGMCRAIKSEWELNIIREGAKRHGLCLTKLLLPLLHNGISEIEICHKISDLFFSKGHLGVLRMQNFGEEIFFGHVSIGDSANYPSVFNGPVSLKGIHPAAPYMGAADVKWNTGKPLIIDNGFTYDGYITDMTQVYWLGDKKNIPANARRAHDFCIDLQAKTAELLKPGTLPSEIWDHCLTEVQSSEWNDGFMGYGKNKVFFVGHGIGLAIDEYPVLTKGFDLPLEEGMTLAIEPKIGIPGFGMVGVENTFEVTTRGGKCLTCDKYDIISI